MVETLTMATVSGPGARSPTEDARLERMFAANHASVWRILRRRGLSYDATADAMQETFMIAVERLNEIQPDSERAFLIRTALQVAYTLGRKTVRWQLEDDMDRRGLDARDTGDARADIQLCNLALSKVEPELAEVFVLYEIEELSSPEIAALLEIPLGSVASRLRRARKKFRAVVKTIERTMDREGHA
jgi:RNA polymerase sigma-70 factor (ECF subfamily)